MTTDKHHVVQVKAPEQQLNGPWGEIVWQLIRCYAADVKWSMILQLPWYLLQRTVGVIFQNSDSLARDAIFQSGVGSVYVDVWVTVKRKISIMPSYNLPLFSKQTPSEPCQTSVRELAGTVRLVLWLSGFPVNATISCHVLSSSFLFSLPGLEEEIEWRRCWAALLSLKVRCVKPLCVKAL